MTNQMIVRHIRAQREARNGWIKILNKNPGSVRAAQHILTVNSKIEFLLTLWNWNDESVEFPYE